MVLGDGVWEDVHSADGENCSDRHLGTHVHLDVPDQEDGHETQSPVCNTRDSGIGVGRINSDFRIDTGSCSTGVLSPEV